jgi:hypothetical protein
VAVDEANEDIGLRNSFKIVFDPNSAEGQEAAIDNGEWYFYAHDRASMDKAIVALSSAAGIH